MIQDPTKPNRKASKLDANNKTTITMHIDKLLERRNWAIPFPLGTDDETLVSLVESTIDPVLLSSIATITTYPQARNILKQTFGTRLYIRGTMLGIVFRDAHFLISASEISINMDSKHIPYTITMDNPHYPALSKWAEDMSNLKGRCQEASRLVYYVVNCCATAGQIARVWPELVKFLPDQHKVALQKRQRASHMPDGIDMLHVNNGKRDATATLALLSLLAETGEARVKI